MYDKVTIRATIDTADTETIAFRNYLEQCTEGDEVYYKSTALANFDGCFVELRGNRLRCKCSICKLYHKGRTGRLDNSRPITFAMAVRTLRELLMRLCVKPENAVATYYEIGITLKLSHPAKEYIGQMLQASGRILWNDANYPEGRQRTTEKSKYFRKVLKAYDKTFESAEKGRHVGDNVLRIETIYKHQSVPLTELTDASFCRKMGRIFYKDWSEVQFLRELSAAKGVKMSQLEKAREIQRIGVTRYKQRYKQLYTEGKLTRKQWETIRTFANHWEEERVKYVEITGELEQEFKERLLHNFQCGIFTPYARTVIN